PLGSVNDSTGRPFQAALSKRAAVSATAASTGGAALAVGSAMEGIGAPAGNACCGNDKGRRGAAGNAAAVFGASGTKAGVEAPRGPAADASQTRQQAPMNPRRERTP